MRAAHAAAMDESRRSPWPAVFGWCFLIFAGAAIGYAFWAMNGSGEPLVRLDVGPRAEALATTPSGPPPVAVTYDGRRAAAAAPEPPPCREFGPIWLDPTMSPVRVDLQAVVAPIGPTRQSYEIALADPVGGVVWEQRGTLADGPAEATSVSATTRLVEFAVRKAGPHRFRVLLPEGSQDDVREVVVAVRTHVVAADARVLVALGLAAFASLTAQILASRRRNTPIVVIPEEEEYREAA